MKSITWKIFIPILLVLVVVFSFLIFFVGKIVKTSIETQFDNQAKVRVDSIYMMVSSLYNTEMERTDALVKSTKDGIEEQTNVALDMVNWFYEEFQKGRLSEQTAQDLAKRSLSSIRYGDNGYFFILNKDYRLLSHPSAEVDVSWKDLQDSTGRYFAREMVDQAVSEGSGFVNYKYPKPGSDVPSDKLGYVKIFKPWGWVIGTGLYTDFIENEKKRMRQETIDHLNSILYVDGKTSEAYPFIKSRDDEYIAYQDQSFVGKTISTIDKKTGEDLTSKYFSIANGPVAYFFTKSGEGDKVFLKEGYVRTFDKLDWVIVYSVYEDVILRSVRHIILLLVLTGLVTILISGGVIMVILIFIVKKVKVAAAGFEEFATGSGNLTKRMEGHGADEVGQLVGSFNKFLDKLHNIIWELKNISRESRDIGNSLNDDSGNISASLEQIVSNVGSIERSSEKLNNHSDLTGSALNDIFNAVEVVNNQIVEEAASVEESSAAIEQMIASVNNIDRISNERKMEIDRLTGMAGESSRQMESTMQDISNIAGSVDSIREIISVINGISSRINLLAMNAAIEAAHAGDAGRGFAVVADEVRKLAESTGENSKRISQSIKTIIDEINNTQKKSQETGEIIVEMEAGSRSVSQMISEVIAAISEVSSGNKQILEALGNLKSSSLAVKDSSALVEDKARFAVDAVQEIAGLSRQNYQGVVEIRGALNEISTSVGHISSLGSQNSENLERINEQVGNFIVGEEEV